MAALINGNGSIDMYGLLESARDILPGGPGGNIGLVLLILAAVGAAWLAWTAAAGAIALLRRATQRSRPASDRATRISGLVRHGAGPAEIARAVGLPRDAISLIVPADAWRGTKVPTSAQSSGLAPAESSARLRLPGRATSWVS